MYVSNEQITYLTADCIANFIDKRKLNTLTKIVLTENFTSFTIFLLVKLFSGELGLLFLISIFQNSPEETTPPT